MLCKSNSVHNNEIIMNHLICWKDIIEMENIDTEDLD